MQKANAIGDREIKAVIMDMDNTLFDFVEAKLKACSAVVQVVGQTDEMELLEYFIKHPKDVESPECIKDYLKDHKRNDNDTFEKCVELYERIKIENIHTYPGVKETLETISNSELRFAIVTDAYKRNAMARLKKTGLIEYFDLIVTGDITGKKKPAPDSILYALKKLNVRPEESVLVGDSLTRDIDLGNKLGMVTVYAAYGDRNLFEDRDCKADHEIDNIAAILEILDLR